MPARKYPTKRIPKRQPKKKSATFERKVTAVINKNIEQKHITCSYTGKTVAQQAAGLNGSTSITFNAVSCWPSNGDGISQRDGNKIKLQYMKLLVNIWGMSSLDISPRINWYFIKQVGALPTFTLGECFNANQVQSDLNSTTIYDNSIMRNPVFMKSYKIMKSGHIQLPVSNNAGTQSGAKEVGIYIPLNNQVVTFNGSSTIPQNVLYTILFTCNYGNRSISTAGTLLGVGTNDTNTGVYFNVIRRTFYKDI